MNALFNKPNLLFLLFVRNQNSALLLSKLRKPIYRTKFIKALTVIITNINGEKKWYLNNNLHREDGPAAISVNGTQKWYKNGLLHREDGPAIIYMDGDQFWYKNGKPHREDGPADIWEDGHQGWYKNGEQVNPF